MNDQATVAFKFNGRDGEPDRTRAADLRQLPDDAADGA